MGSFSIWHWLIVLVGIFLPLYFILTSKTDGPNRFGELPPAMSFTEAISSFFRNYANFEGRASRSAFWYAVLFNLLVGIALRLVDPTERIDTIWSLAVLLPNLALAARRLHDTNRSGWYQLVGWMVPIGSIGIIVWFCSPANDGTSVAASPSNTPATRDSVELLEKLNALRQSGAITDAEYENEKRKILKG